MTFGARSDRQRDERFGDTDQRSSFARDRDRILHSPEFQRLRHVTQVMAPTAPLRFHNRRSHSLEVARIGSALATALQAQRGNGRVAACDALDPDVVEAACLAHDLGHPPFGHDAESELDRLLCTGGVEEGFEANAQSFRIVSRLAGEAEGDAGMNLTRATLAATLKYPWRRHGSPAHPGKWGAYASEQEELNWARALLPPGSLEPTLEAAVMDWADMIAYAVHDFEDFARAGLIPLAELSGDVRERERFLALVCDRRGIASAGQEGVAEIFQQMLTACPASREAAESRSERNALRCYTNQAINRAIAAVELARADGGSLALRIDPVTTAEIWLFEGLTWHYVIASDLLSSQREEQRALIRSLFAILADTASAMSDLSLFTSPQQERLRSAASDEARLRIVSDVIAGMTEVEAMERSHQVSSWRV